MTGRRRGVPFWPDRVLGPPPGMMEWNVVCWTLFIAGLLVPISVVQFVQAKHEAHPIRQLNSDFVYVYGVGWIARTYFPSRIYDLALQQQVFRSVQPPRNGFYGPSPYPPFVALFFAPFTYLSFEAAYLLWFGLSLALYMTGVVATAFTIFPRDKLSRSLIYCFALAFYPFLFGTLLNGQLASVAICATGIAIYQENRGRPFLSGLALSLLCYKPTLLLLLVPMLLLTRRFKTMLGFLSGAGTLLLATTLFAGAGIWPLYARTLLSFGKITGAAGVSHLEIWKYLDLTSCLRAVSGNGYGAVTVILSVIMIAIGITLAVELWKSPGAATTVQWLVWAATLTWTLLLNVYVPIYDAVLVIIAIVLTMGALRDMAWERAKSWLLLTAILIFALSWRTESIAHAHRIQLLTVMLLVLGVLQLLLLRRAIRMNHPLPSACGVASL